MIQRYDIYNESGDSGELNEHEEGEWVKYNDHMVTLTRLAMADQITINKFRDQRDHLQITLDRLSEI